MIQSESEESQIYKYSKRKYQKIPKEIKDELLNFYETNKFPKEHDLQHLETSLNFNKQVINDWFKRQRKKQIKSGQLQSIKKKKFTKNQITKLFEYYQNNNFRKPIFSEFKSMAREIGLSPIQIRAWFNSHRRKIKKNIDDDSCSKSNDKAKFLQAMKAEMKSEQEQQSQQTSSFVINQINTVDENQQQSEKNNLISLKKQLHANEKQQQEQSIAAEGFDYDKINKKRKMNHQLKNIQQQQQQSMLPQEIPSLFSFLASQKLSDFEPQKIKKINASNDQTAAAEKIHPDHSQILTKIEDRVSNMMQAQQNLFNQQQWLQSHLLKQNFQNLNNNEQGLLMKQLNFGGLPFLFEPNGATSASSAAATAANMGHSFNPLLFSNCLPQMHLQQQLNPLFAQQNQQFSQISNFQQQQLMNLLLGQQQYQQQQQQQQQEQQTKINPFFQQQLSSFFYPQQSTAAQNLQNLSNQLMFMPPAAGGSNALANLFNMQNINNKNLKKE